MNAIIIIIVVIVFILFGPRIIATLKAAAPAMGGTPTTTTTTNGNGNGNGNKTVTRQNPNSVHTSGRHSCACSNGVCQGECNSGNSSSKSCTCTNGNCIGDCDDMDMLDPDTFDPFKWVQEHS